jgi:(3S)-malyl-CoA thioesterase
VEFADTIKHVRTALYVPALNARALEKARGLDVDMVIIDLEDSVPDESKAAAREAAVREAACGFPGKLVAIRINAADSEHNADDVAAVRGAKADCFVIPKVERPEGVAAICAALGKPVLAMIENSAGIYAARDIANSDGVAGLIAGANDICAETGIRPGPNREGLQLALQSIVLAAASAGIPAFDGVCNRLDDLEGYDAECRQGRCYGFAGKTLIHPNQIAAANAAFGPGADDVADARAMIEAATGGAQRFRGRMIETMHVEESRRTLERAKSADETGA